MPLTTPQLWPAATDPSISILSIAGVTVPADPLNTFNYATPDVQTMLDTSQPVAIAVVIQATNVPLNWDVEVRAVSQVDGTAYQVPAIMQPGGSLTSSTWIATLALPAANNVASIIASATAPQ